MKKRDHSPTAGLVDINVVAKTLGVSPRTCYVWWQSGRIPGFKFGYRCVRFDLSEVKEAVLGPARVEARQN